MINMWNCTLCSTTCIRPRHLEGRRNAVAVGLTNERQLLTWGDLRWRMLWRQQIGRHRSMKCRSQRQDPHARVLSSWWATLQSEGIHRSSADRCGGGHSRYLAAFCHQVLPPSQLILATGLHARDSFDKVLKRIASTLQPLQECLSPAHTGHAIIATWRTCTGS